MTIPQENDLKIKNVAVRACACLHTKPRDRVTHLTISSIAISIPEIDHHHTMSLSDFIAKGEAALAEKRFQYALDAFTEVGRISPSFPPLHTHTDTLTTTLSLYIYTYPQALALDESSPTIHLGRARANNKLENYVEAAADALRATELDPKLAAAHAERGKALHDLDEFESAKESFEMASVLEPTRKIHRTWVNMCNVALGQEMEQQDVGTTGTRVGATNSGMRPRLPVPGAPSSTQKTAVTADDAEFLKYWKQTLPPHASPLPSALNADRTGTSGPKYRHQWFQTNKKVEVAVMAKKKDKDKVKVTVESTSLHVVVLDDSKDVEYELHLELWGEVDPAMSRYEVLGSKVEVQLMKKRENEQWMALERGQGMMNTKMTTTSDIAVDANANALQEEKKKKGKKDWDSVERQVKKEEEEEEASGDAAVMKFFRQLYGDSDEDTRRAMMKSYLESGGTALSTNWQEVGKQDFSEKRAQD